MSGKGGIVVVSAPSGAGKSTLVKKLRGILTDLDYSVSLTTRDPRPGEKDGVDYHFVSRERFQDEVAAGNMAEWAEVFGNLYGTSMKVLEKAMDQGRDILLEIDIEGAEQMMRRFPEGLFLFVLPPSLAELKRRLTGRGTEDPEVVETRLARAEAEMAKAPEYTNRVVNDELDRAAAEAVDLIGAWRKGRRE